MLKMFANSQENDCHLEKWQGKQNSKIEGNAKARNYWAIQTYMKVLPTSFVGN